MVITPVWCTPARFGMHGHCLEVSALAEGGGQDIYNVVRSNKRPSAKRAAVALTRGASGGKLPARRRGTARTRGGLS